MLISPEPSETSLNIKSTSASDSFSPMEVKTCFSSAAEINPSPFLSKTLKASNSSCSESLVFSCLLIRAKNSENSILWFPSTSISFIRSATSASEGDRPRDLITVASSLAEMEPSLSLSKRAKASLNSAICSSVRFWDIVFTVAKRTFFSNSFVVCAGIHSVAQKRIRFMPIFCVRVVTPLVNQAKNRW